MKKITLTFYRDPGHGWLKVPVKVIKHLNLQDQITTYSFQRNKHVYLEEDCDAPKVLNKLKEHNILVEIKEKHTNKSSKIRTYNHYINSLNGDVEWIQIG